MPQDEQMASLKKLTERYCVVYQTLLKGVEIETGFRAIGNQINSIKPIKNPELVKKFRVLELTTQLC